ncbi:MAG: polysaccharide biosynthesis C-terminal domain-containing protein, partial [Patescibacteria group bacterium]
AVVALSLARRLTGSLRFSFRASELLKIFVPAIPLGLAILFNLVYFHVDSVILALTRSTLEVGIYGLAYKVFEVSLVLPTFFMNAVYPLLLRATGESEVARSKFRKLFFRSLYFLSLGSLFSLIVFWVAAPLLTLVRPDFALSIAALRVFALGLPLFFVSALLFWTLIALGKQKLLVVIYGIAMVANILSNLVFIPRYGYMAAAWITVVSEGLVLLMLIGFLRRILKPIFYAN